jgi:hypothetical protein
MKEPGKTIGASPGPPHVVKLENRDCQRSRDGLPTYCSAVKRGTVLTGTANVSLTNEGPTDSRSYTDRGGNRGASYSWLILELLIGNVFELTVTPLKGGVIYQNIDAPESIDRFLGDLFGYRSFADIARKKNRFAASLGNQTFRLLGILVLRKVRDCNIRSLSSESEGYRPARYRYQLR